MCAVPIPQIRFLSGHKFSISFDEATVVGTDRYLTLNLHHYAAFFGKSNIAPLGLIRVKERATAKALQEAVSIRLDAFNLSRDDLGAGATDGTKNVLKAVKEMGLNVNRAWPMVWI